MIESVKSLTISTPLTKLLMHALNFTWSLLIFVMFSYHSITSKRGKLEDVRDNLASFTFQDTSVENIFLMWGFSNGYSLALSFTVIRTKPDGTKEVLRGGLPANVSEVSPSEIKNMLLKSSRREQDKGAQENAPECEEWAYKGEYGNSGFLKFKAAMSL